MRIIGFLGKTKRRNKWKDMNGQKRAHVGHALSKASGKESDPRRNHMVIRATHQSLTHQSLNQITKCLCHSRFTDE
jgi:hypothetical protein